ncbi:MAG TPA: HD domain-containing phosphohydrolase [Pyrinomonadaceae bacterium]|jgi:response regulator RpfG family c-di-GMP phosphodiesterase
MNINQSTSYKILIVDDEPANLRLLERLFRREYQVIAATSGAEALELLEMHDVAVILSDERMPGMTGIEFLKRASEMRPHTVRIILTGYTDVNSLVEAINSGVVYKYVPKPWGNEDLQQTIVRAIEHYETIKNQYQLKLRADRLSEQLQSSKEGFVRFAAEALDAQDAFLHEHLRRTSDYAVAVGHRLDLEGGELEQLALAGFLHKIGRLIVPDRYWQGNECAADDERRSVKNGAERAARRLKNFPGMEEVAATVRYHDEHYDGTAGDNLCGEQIPLFARIVAVAAAYDRMTSPQISAKTLTHAEALEKLQKDAGKRFDPKIVKAIGELHSISRIREALREGVVGMRLYGSSVACDADDFTTAELLQKFKTEPMLAMDVLHFANTTSAEPTAKLMAAMSALGEEKLRSIIRQYGLPPVDGRTKAASARAVRRAVAAQLMTAHTDVIHPDEAYTLGLLYDAGETLLLNLFPDEMLFLEEYDENERLRRQVEIFGINPAQISRRMLEVCGIPANLAAAVENRQDSMSVGNPTALLLRIADVISADSVDKTAALKAIVELPEVLNLSRADLHKIYERANFINQGRVEAPEQIPEPVY